MNVSSIISLLEATAATTGKRDILEAEKNNDVLRSLFMYTYNPRFKYGIRVANLSGVGSGCLDCSIIADVVNHLNNRLVTGNSARAYVEKVAADLLPKEAECLARMINRDMSCKVSEGLLNATWPDLIPKFPQMLAEPFSEKLVKPFLTAKPDSLVVQLKCDAGRAHVVVDQNGAVTLYSRAGNILEVNGKFDFLSEFKGLVIDGELMSFNAVTGKFNDRKTSNGIYTKTVRGTAIKSETDTLHLVAWDVIDENDFWNRKSDVPYRDRLAKLSTIINIVSASNNKQNISLVPGEIISTVDQAQAFYAKMVGLGEEGAMLKFLDDGWEDIRSKRILKMKEIKDATLICVGFTEHQKKAGWIGSLVCETSDGQLQTSVGTGLTDDDRQKSPEEFIGKLVDVKYNQLIKGKGKDAKPSMFLPVFCGVRTDVSSADPLSKLT